MTGLESMLIAGVAVPLASFVFLALFGAKLGKPVSGWFATVAIAASTVLSTVVLVQWLGMDPAARAAAQSEPLLWAYLGSTPLTFGVNLDSLTVIMFFMVSFVSTCIHVFSIGYMAGHSDEVDGQSKYHRFFAYLSLFCFSMLGLVISSSLLFLFIFWELVGLCSYLLIGFYFDKKSASNAAIKAFVANRVGDVGFIIGLSLVYLYLGDLSLAGAANAFQAEHGDPNSPLFNTTFIGLSLATWMGMLLFCGAIGKSAQFPLHVWLPDAMEGPTPVSALIHAATMVAAGVYLSARIFVLFTPEAQLFVAIIGCITLMLGALIAIVQTDIKRVLAYSTISQLGYMILGIGIGAWVGALFHLLTHAFFKAMLFLGSGQVIEGCHHEQDMRRMGGLRHKMPVTCWTFFIGVLAISGVGIPLLGIGIGGYFSKDEILAVAYVRAYPEAVHHSGDHESHGHDDGHDHSSNEDASRESVELAAYAAADATAHSDEGASSHDHKQEEHAGPAGISRLHPLLFWLPIVAAYITPFYMMRCWWMTFMGKPRDEHVHEHAHETPLMYIPLVVLAVGTVVVSYFLFRDLVLDAVPLGFLVPAIHDEHVLHGAHRPLAWIVGGAFLVGFAVAYLIYRNGLDLAGRFAWRFRAVHQILVHKFFFDEIYGFFLVGGVHVLKYLSYLFDRVVVDGLVNVSAGVTERLARFSGRQLDNGLVDGAVNGVGQGTYGLGGLVRTPQVGRIRNYILFTACGATVVVLLLVTGW